MASKIVPKQYQKVPPETWEEVGRQYVSGKSPSLICRLYGISSSTFYSRREKHGWTVAPTCSGKPADPLVPGHVEYDTYEETRSYGSGDSRDQQLSTAANFGLPPNSEIVLDPTTRSEVTAQHLSLARALHFRLERLAADDRLGAGPQGRQSRSAVDLATALEKLQRIERKALGMDESHGEARQQVVIVVPQKLEIDEWERRARDMGEAV